MLNDLLEEIISGFTSCAIDDKKIFRVSISKVSSNSRIRVYFFVYRFSSKIEAFGGVALGIVTFLISLFGFGGVLNVIVVILPTKLLFLLGLILLSVISCEHTGRNYRSGGSIFCYEFFACQKSSFLCIGILLLVSIVLELIFLPWLSTLLILAN